MNFWPGGGRSSRLGGESGELLTVDEGEAERLAGCRDQLHGNGEAAARARRQRTVDRAPGVEERDWCRDWIVERTSQVFVDA